MASTPGDKTLQEQRHLLPIYPARGPLLREIKANDCCIVVGETGSGKTTQIPQYLLEAGFAKKSGIAVTQPRRVAAVSIAQRVADERGCGELGREVGYSVRFDDCSSSATRLKFMTDGMLLREAISDPLLTRYGVVCLDEAHERTVHTDLLFGIVKSAQNTRSKRQLRKLRIIIMSATLAAEEFSQYFNKAKILYIQGRQFPVDVHYTLISQSDYVNAAVVTVLQLHQEEVKEGKSKGDILVFLSGREEIESIRHILAKCQEMFPSDWLEMLVCPLYAALPSSQQQKVFQLPPPGTRKVVLATNIAETSITIPGVSYVVDTGVVKAKGYNPHIGLDLLKVQPVSKAQARQRTGRAGREAAGYCYRLYTTEHFEALPEDTVPEIQRSSLSSVVLQLLALGVNDVLSFDFMSPPPGDALLRAVEQLYFLGAVEKKEEKKKKVVDDDVDGKVDGDVEDYRLQLTSLGSRLAQFPLEPVLAMAILSSQELGCCHEALSVVSMMSVESVVFSPREKKEQVDAARRKFVSIDGDHMTMLNIYRAYKSVKGNKAWCKENFIHIRNMKTVYDIRHQLHELCGRVGVAMTTGGADCSENLRKALLKGLFLNVAEHTGEGKYKTLLSRQDVFIHPSSCLFHTKPHPLCVVYSQLVFTSKCYMRDVSIIDLEWLKDVAPSYYNRRLSS